MGYKILLSIVNVWTQQMYIHKNKNIEFSIIITHQQQNAKKTTNNKQSYILVI